MCAGARLVRPKETVADTAGNALFLCPLHGLVVVGAGGYITERACLNFLEKGNNGSDEHSVVGRQISHCNGLRMSCCISRNRNIGSENRTIICTDLNFVSTCLQINRVCYFLTIHFNDYIRQLGGCYNKRNCILRCRQKGRSIRIKSIIAAGSSNLIKEILSFHIFKGLCCTCFRILTASSNIFCFNEIIVFKNRCIRRNTADNTA